MYASRIEPLPHQLTAVYGAMLGRQPLRFLLADDPGAGKTVMAGLLMKELAIRGGLERCLIVAPGSLVEQWQDELAEKFDLRFDILTRERLAAAGGAGAFEGPARLIARLDMLARDDALQAKLEAAPAWDLAVCDEAHRMSAHVFGGKTVFTRRYRLGAAVARRARHLLSMTATPHNGRDEEFQLFMALLDPDRFAGRPRGGAPKADLSGAMRRLTKEELVRFDGSPLFPERRAHTVSYALSPREAELYEAVTSYVREGMDRAEGVAGAAPGRGAAVGFALQLLQRRLASSPAAIHESLRRRLARLKARRDDERSGRAAAEAPGALPFDDEWDDLSADEREEREERIAAGATAARGAAGLDAEIAELRALEAMARALRRSGEDAKWRELDRILDDPAVRGPAPGARRKLVVFTESRDTLAYLEGRIRDRTGDPEAVAVIHGGVPRGRRRAIVAAFGDDPKLRFLLANDAAGEGVNLQRGAHLMVNYDLPWNPNRLEQRFGRIHRIGQTEVCHLWSLVAGETREGAVYERLLEKLEAARGALGGKVYNVLGSLFEDRPLRDLFVEAVRYGERPDVRRRLFRAVESAAAPERIEALAARNRLAGETLDPAAVRRVRDDMERAAARRLQPHHVRSFFEAAFAAAGGAARAREKGRLELVRVPAALRRAGPGSAGAPPVPPRYRRVCFDKADADGGGPDRPPAALIGPGHPLLDALTGLTLERLGGVLTRGAVLADDETLAPAPRILVCLRHAVRDGRTAADGAPQTVSERLQFVWLDADGAAADAGPAPYLDLRPPRAEERGRAAALAGAARISGPDVEERALAFAAAVLAPRHLRAARERLLPETDRAEEAVRDRLRREIAWTRRRALELEAEERADGAPRPDAAAMRREAAALAARLEARLAEFGRRRELAPLPPAVCGAALVAPAALLAPEPGERGAAGGAADAGAPDAASRAAVEAAAMRAVMDRERALGHEPRDVSAENRGYDIESRERGTGRLRFIEVKGRRADARAATVTRNEMLAAFNARTSYILALVPVSAGRAARPLYVPDPAPLFGPEPGFAEVSRAISVEAIRRAAEAAGIGQHDR